MKTFKEYLTEGIDKSDLKSFESYMKEIDSNYTKLSNNVDDLLREIQHASDLNIDNQMHMVYKSLEGITKNYDLLIKHLERTIKTAQGK